MLVHKNCHGFVLVVKKVEFLSPAIITNNGIKSVIGDINFAGSEQLSYRCAHCKQEVTIEDIEDKCYNCGDYFGLDKLYWELETGGEFCESCHMELYGHMRHITPVKNLLSKDSSPQQTTNMVDFNQVYPVSTQNDYTYISPVEDETNEDEPEEDSDNEEHGQSNPSISLDDLLSNMAYTTGRPTIGRIPTDRNDFDE